MELSRRGFFAGLVGALGALVGLKVVRGAALPIEEKALFEMLPAACYAPVLPNDDALNWPPLAGRQAIDLEEARERAYRAYAHSSWPPARRNLPPDDWYEQMPAELRDLARLRDYYHRAIADYALMAMPPPIYLTRQVAERLWNETPPVAELRMSEMLSPSSWMDEV